MVTASDRVENIVVKGENAGYYQHFLLFPQCFQKASFLWSLKVGIVWYRDLNANSIETRVILYLLKSSSDISSIALATLLRL